MEEADEKLNPGAKSESPRRKLAIVGGGAAGIFAALGAAHAARKEGLALTIVIIERNPRLGIKILISGGGKCNITHAGKVNSVLKEGFLYSNELRFLRHALHSYTNEDVLTLLTRQGVAWHARENGRIFPDSGRAEDVLEAFERELAAESVEIQTSSRVLSIEKRIANWIIGTERSTINADAVILATGGISYSKVGTTGDGIRQAAGMGHDVIPLRSALAPIYLTQVPPFELQGTALRSAVLDVWQDGTRAVTMRGDVLITHKGLSGPATLDVSRRAAELLERGPIVITCNVLGCTAEKLREDLKQVQQARASQRVGRWLAELLPNRFVGYVLNVASLADDVRWNGLTKEGRVDLASALLQFPFGEVSEIPIERGEVTAGGISLAEIDPKTMMSTIHDGLYIVGEMLDIAGEIGGFNLQAAYSTGWLAGISAVTHLTGSK